MTETIFSIKGLSKNFPGIQALKNVSIDIQKGTVHCIVGENGAGKSTFIKILTCAETRTSGEMFFEGKPYNPKTIRDAMHAGISTLFQELNVVDELSVEDNLSLGRENSRFGVIARGGNERAVGILHDFAPDIPLKRKVSALSFAEKQIVEIVRAICVEASVIVMDEPTAALSVREAQRIFDVIGKLKSGGVTIIYISHILDDIFTIGDFVTVLRDGEVIGTRIVSEVNDLELIRMMVGKVMVEKYRPRKVNYSKKIVEVVDLTTQKIKRVSFDLYEGEIIGFYGLRGAGKTELSHALYGMDRVESGYIRIEGELKSFSLPKDSIMAGIAMIPEERLSEGVILQHSVTANIVISNPRKSSTMGVVNRKRERSIAEHFVKLVGIRARSIEQRVGTLSGGNQQKVVVSKCINASSKILMMDEPTRGIDVGAKVEIHNIIRDLAEDGVSIIVFSSELPEIMNLCDRIYLLLEGRVIDEIRNSEVDPEGIVLAVSQANRREDEVQL